MNRQTPTVLTIDDEPLVRESVAAFLEDSGFNVIEAENGQEGLDLYHEYHPDVILCDLYMPIMGGLEFLTTIRNIDEEIPFIIVSGAGVVHDAVEALRLGAWDFIIKPITDMGALEHAIDRSLERHRLLNENKLYREELEITNRELKESLAVLKEDQEAGRCIQFQLLPEKTLSFEPFDFTHHIIPSLYLSGDFVDYFCINDNYVGFYIIDVSGHGAPSAFVTVLLKSLVDQFINRFRGEMDSIILDPSILLKRLSTEILNAHLGKYLTMFYAVIDRKTDMMHYSIGGHFPNPIIAHDGQITFLEGSGFPIGVFDKAEYRTYTLQLPKNFNMVMFSDGVLEILEQEELKDKEEFLLSLIGDDHQVSIESLLEKLNLNDVREMPDDITFLLLNRGQ